MAATNGDINIIGENGSDGYRTTAPSLGILGKGGGSSVSPGTKIILRGSEGSAGADGAGYGAGGGGGGGIAGALAGGAGTAGIIIIEY